MKTIIIGGVAGGMSAATRLRRLDEKRQIVVLERGPYVSFANCGLPYYIGGIVADRASLLLQTPESLAARFALDVRVHHDVVAIDAEAKTVGIVNRETGATSTESYDDLVIATGASTQPTASDIPTHTLLTVGDVDRVIEVLDAAGDSAHAVVVGAGFIGLEAVENLLARGVTVTLVQRGDQVMSPLDPEMAQPVHRALSDAGVDVRTGATVTATSEGSVLLSDGSRVRTDLIIEASGVRPQSALAREAGLRIGATGGIAVDARQRTSDPSIWAVGDGVEKIDHVDSEPALVTMAGLANRHGRAAADAIAGASAVDAAPALGASIIGVLGLAIATVGWSEKRLVAAGRAHRVVHTHPASHAGFYPGAQQMAMKLLIDPHTDSILGAQIVGRDGVDKRIDIISVAMSAGITASGLSRLELAYAPQFASAKDPVNLLGYVAENLATGATRSIQWHEVDAAVASGAVLVDVRTAGEHASGSIPGAINLPVDELRERHGELPDAPIVVHCQVGQRGHTAARILSQLGHDVSNLDGGWKTWSAGTAAQARDAGGASADMLRH